MAEKTLIYLIPEIPDRSYAPYQMKAGGDVLQAVGGDFEHLFRIISSLPPHSLTLSFRMHFTPENVDGDQQSRLRLFIVVRLHDPSVEAIIRSALEDGPLRKFYALHRVEEVGSKWERYGAVCEIRRRTDEVQPLYDKEFNARVPDSYYMIMPFEPNDRNDYMDLDLILSHTRESILIDLCAEPVDISKEQLEHARYLADLKSINRAWGLDDDELESVDYVGEDSDKWASRSQQVIKPPRYQDPIADDILREQGRFHETLLRPHLLFSVSVFAETPPMACLIGSFVAESSFSNGSYEMFLSRKGEEEFQSCLREVKECCL